MDSSRIEPEPSAFGPWTQPPLGEVLGDEAFSTADPVSRSQRRSAWEREHEALDALWRQNEHDLAVKAFRQAVDGIRGSRLRSWPQYVNGQGTVEQ